MKKSVIISTPETTTIDLNKSDHPIAFREAVVNLMESGLSEEETEKIIEEQGVEL